MPKEYQSEKSPIIDSQKSKKTRRKLLKMSHIKASKVDQMFCNTLYTPLPRDKGWECGGGNIAIMGHLVRTSSNHYAHLHWKLLTNERSVFSLHRIIICCRYIATILLYQCIENLPMD